jgi:hypothetical protein
MGKMEQEVAHSQGGCNSKCAMQNSGEMTLMVHMYIEDGSLLLRLRMLSDAPDCIDS